MATDPRVILHVDMDAFFASVEQRDHPELRGRPVLVGGRGPRGVVAAASYEARAFGCHSAQPMSRALRMCPSAVVMPVRGSVYRETSAAVFRILESFTPLVEPLSVDEAFLDVSGCMRLHGDGATIARTIRARVSDELRLTCSAGVAPNKFLAKLASGMHKPDALTIIDPACVRETISPLPIEMMWGVGPTTASRLRKLGIKTFADVLDLPTTTLETCVGSFAHRLQHLARGEDDRPVTPDHRAKSISHEQTFGQDLANPQVVREVLLEQTEAVAVRLRRHDLAARSVTVKIRFGDFETITRSCTLDDPTNRTDLLWRAAAELYDQWTAHSFQPVRLIGVAAGNLGANQSQLNLFAQGEDAKRASIDQTTDLIKQLFGRDAIHLGVRSAPERRPDASNQPSRRPSRG